MLTEDGRRFIPVSSSERHATLLPDDVWFWVSSNLAFEDNTASLHQLLNGRLLDEEGSSRLSCAHLHHRLFLCLNSNTEGNQQLVQILQLNIHAIFQWNRTTAYIRHNYSPFLLCDSYFSDSRHLLSALNFF